jgi:hypothetical protein
MLLSARPGCGLLLSCEGFTVIASPFEDQVGFRTPVLFGCIVSLPEISGKPGKARKAGGVNAWWRDVAPESGGWGSGGRRTLKEVERPGKGVAVGGAGKTGGFQERSHVLRRVNEGTEGAAG